MTRFGRATGWRALQRIVRLGSVCVCLAIVPAQAMAARVAVVLSNDATPYQEVYQVIRAYLDDTPQEAVRLYADDLTPAALNDARLVVAVGVEAADTLTALPEQPPVLAILVPRAWYLKAGHARPATASRRKLSTIYLDQPFERQARLIRLALPDVRRVGVLLSVEQSSVVNELDDALRAQGLSLVHATLTPNERLITPLETVLSEADLLLALPDPLVFNRNTAQSLFLTSYRYRDPVLGYSRSLTRAGALLSLHSSPAQIGRQAAEWIDRAIQGAAVLLPPPAYPSYFSISVNDQVARSLGFALPSATELETRLRGRD